jgi:predicted  nucleic acid-binding Zn-ribbon protein
LDALALELVQLERRERDISARRRKLHERLDAFPSEHAERQARELSAERRRIHKQIDELRAQLARLA